MSQSSNDTAEKRTRVSSAEDREPAKKKSSGGKKTVSAGKAPARKKPVSSQQMPDGRKVLSGQKVSDGKRTAPVPKVSDERRAPSAPKESGERRTAPVPKVSGERRTAPVPKVPDERKPLSGQKVSDERKMVSGQKTSDERASSSGQKMTEGRKAASGRKAADGRKTPAGKKKAGKRRPAPNRKPSSRVKSADEGKTGNSAWDEAEPRMNRRDEERARRRAERERKVKRQKVVMAVSSCVILLSVIGIIVFCLPSIRVSLKLFQGDRYMEKEDYTSAQSAYEKALEVDPGSVKAYYGLANLYDKQEMAAEEEQILYTGWEQTQNEDLLHYYSVAVLNQAVAEINSRNCTLATVEKCIRALEQGTEDAKALEILGVCHDRLFTAAEGEDTCMMFFDEDTVQDTCSYNEYEQLLRRLLAVCQARPSEEIKQTLKQFAVIDMPYVRISLPHVDTYSAVLTEINSMVNDADVSEMLACLARAKEVRDYFDTAFNEFGSGNYAYARELVTEETYMQIRDQFIEENSGYWEGSIYIPVNREQLVLHRDNGNVRFSFLDSDSYENRQGIIKVWGTKQEDDGVQRSGISYVPVEEAGAESHVEYTVQYLYSNVKINGKYVPQMNYRFDTTTTTSEGVTTNAIGDWGGENEWEIDY